MTNIEAIGYADELKRNEVSPELKARWLTELDQNIYRDVLSTHEGELPVMPKYNSVEETVLFAPAPYDTMYPRYLIMKMDEKAQETNKYNASVVAFNDIYQEYVNWYNRNNMPLRKRVRYW